MVTEEIKRLSKSEKLMLLHDLWDEISDDPDVFVESIPFLESRTYIRKIYVNLAAYRRLYGDSSPNPP